MPDIKVTCPHCGYWKRIPEGLIPPGIRRATCPRCKESFDLSGAMTQLPDVSLVPPPEPAPQPSGDTGESRGRKPPPTSFPFIFTGSAREYFGIWIVNTLLKIVTLGIYTAWAKVRKRRYFYGSTRLNDATFEYLAAPLALFKGWLIAVSFFLIYSFGSKASPGVGALFSLLFFVLMPWLVVRSRVFNQRNSAHRNIRFDFHPNYREAYVVFAGLPILLPFTLGLLFPYMVYRQKRFMVENSAYGNTACRFDASPRDFYLVFLKAAGWLVVMIALFVLGTMLFSSTLQELAPLLRPMGKAGADGLPQKVGLVIAIGTILFMVCLYLFFAIYVQTALSNLTWNATRMGSSRFASTLRVRDMAWLYLSSAVAIFLSLGLLIPWVSVRIARYRLENLSLNLADDPQSFAASNREEISAAGEELGDMFGVDIAL